ncbi:hypothetical protein BS78_05G117800 [Paspalum vaginatum]|nr:hypothetical protein BS78_05G117800 [Paspalum vaginatum]
MACNATHRSIELLEALQQQSRVYRQGHPHHIHRSTDRHPWPSLQGRRWRGRRGPTPNPTQRGADKLAARRCSEDWR